VRRALSDEQTSLDQVVRLIGSEPALAARLLKLANSATLNRTGKPVTDLRMAINRMGYNLVRSAAIAFAMSQMRQAVPLAILQAPLKELWVTSTHVAAVCFVLGRRAGLNADEALLTGLLHGVGKLYILTRAGKHPHLFDDEDALSSTIRDWHAGIGKAIIENWEFPEIMATAINDQEDLERDHEGGPDLTDVLIGATMMARLLESPEQLELDLQGIPAFGRLDLSAANCVEVMTESAVEIAALRQALGN
jgi:HD-like signal output (HDOD) protein